ncbi:MAG: hypothetical protein AAFR20_12115 [Pseudomonadota bacterium]
MKFVRLLSGAVAYTIILLEVYSGAIQGPLWWVLPGGLVLSLLIAIQLQYDAGAGADDRSNPLINVAQWVGTLALAFGASYVANYFGREMIPCELLKLDGWTGPADIVRQCGR